MMKDSSPLTKKTKTKTYSIQSEDPNMGRTKAAKKRMSSGIKVGARLNFGKKRGILKKKGISTFDFDDTIR